MGNRRPYIFFSLSSVFILATLIVLFILYFNFSPSTAYLVGINATGLIVMGLDKSFARSGALRVPEKVLHGVALVGGSIGVLLGINFFRHKSRKPAFQIILVLLGCAQVLLLRALGLSARV